VTWTRLDDDFWSNPKVVAVGNEAAGAYARMLSYCGRHLTDGRVPAETASFITRPTVIRRLEEYSFIVRNGAGYVIPDYLEFNPSREKVLAERRKAAERQAKSRGKSRRD
jgi:hypothetical protein